MFSKRIFSSFLCGNNVQSVLKYSKGRTALFFDPNVQNLLKSITSTDLDTAFPVIKIGQRLKPPEYKFMTDEELSTAVKEATARSQKWLQTPPVIDECEDNPKVISQDPALDGYDTDKSLYVFTDITFGIQDRDRLIVVREPTGTLKEASLDQRHRITEIYSPRPGRELCTPAMFKEEQLESLLDRKEYSFILDRACAQFEPDDPEYVKVTSTVYDRIGSEKDFRYVKGTRHYGALVFYLVFNKNVDTLLLENIQNDRLDDAVSIVQLYQIMHPQSQTPSLTTDKMELLKNFIANDTGRRNILELALQSLIERLESKRNLTDSVEKTHGISN